MYHNCVACIVFPLRLYYIIHTCTLSTYHYHFLCMYIHNTNYILNCINYHFFFTLQLSLPTPITERDGHTAVLFGTGLDFRVVVLFGGRNILNDDILETTLLLLCKSSFIYTVSLFDVMYMYKSIITHWTTCTCM